MPASYKKTLKRICDLFSKDNYTIAEVCAIVGISERCYYNWQAKNADFAENVARARDKFDELLVKEAKNSLRRKVLGYDVEETKTVFIESKEIDPATGKPKPKIKEKTTTKRHFQPDTAAIVFALTNKAPDEWKNRQNNEVTGKGGKDLFAGISDEELDKRIIELQSKLEK